MTGATDPATCASTGNILILFMRTNNIQPVRKLTLILAALCFSALSHAQHVEDILVDILGEEIRITYRIVGSTEPQFFHVTLTCSLDGGPRFEPVSVRGDVGSNIQGGKPVYSVLWDVFKDVEQVGNAEFFIKIDLETDLDVVTSPEPIQPEYQDVEVDHQASEPGEKSNDFQIFDRRAFIAYSGSLGNMGSPYGISVGLIKNWGFYGSFRFGGIVGEYISNVWLTATVGATKYIIGNERYRLHGYAGLGTTFESYEDNVFNTSWTDTFFTADAGLIGVLGFVNLTLGMEYITFYGANMVFGIGFVF